LTGALAAADFGDLGFDRDLLLLFSSWTFDGEKGADVAAD
jgi:hypothetical protein